MRTKPLESVIETYFKDSIKKSGALSYKFKSTINGVPDQIVIHNGAIYLVEIKRPDETPRANQIRVHEKINAQNVPVYTIDTEIAVDEFLKNVLKVSIPEKKESKQKHITIITNQFVVEEE